MSQILWATGYQLNVCLIQFIKGSWKYVELFSKKRFNDLLDFYAMGREFTFKSENLKKDKNIADKGWKIAKAAMTSDKYFVVILDELTYLLNNGFIDTDEVMECIQKRRRNLHVIITGHDAPRPIIEAVDMLTTLRTNRSSIH